MKIEKFKILAGLPAYGEIPEQCSATGMGSHSEGFVVEFYPSNNSAWVGNFQLGLMSYCDVVAHPDGCSAIVIAGGEAYVVNIQNRKLIGTFGAMIDTVIPIPEKGIVLFGDCVQFWAYGSSGCLWRSRRISWDGIRSLTLKGEPLPGEA